MEQTYERQLESVVAGIPEEGCLVALASTTEPDQGAALASDLAQLVGQGRAVHTLLVAVENAPAALDHEIGVEGGAGLTEILAGKSTVADVAAHGRARGFIFIPAGGAPGDATEILGSTAFQALCSTAVRRGGTVLAFVPYEVLRRARVPKVDGVVWLGPTPPADGIPTGWNTLGSLMPPGSVTEAETADPASKRPPTATKRPPIKIGPRRTPDPLKSRASRRPVIAAILLLVFVAAMALTVFVVTRNRGEASFLPENDALWLSGSPPAPAVPTDSPPTDSTP